MKLLNVNRAPPTVEVDPKMGLVNINQGILWLMVEVSANLYFQSCQAKSKQAKLPHGAPKWPHPGAASRTFRTKREMSKNVVTRP